MFVVHAVLICDSCFFGNVRVIMSVVHVVVWACRLPVEWTGTPPVEWTGRRLPAEWTGCRLPAEWTGLNKCRGRVAQRPYVRLCLLAYVTCSRPRGSIGSPPGRGAEAYTIRSGHVSAPDPRLSLIKA
jgi:hypothetical protein